MPECSAAPEPADSFQRHSTPPAMWLEWMSHLHPSDHMCTKYGTPQRHTEVLRQQALLVYQMCMHSPAHMHAPHTYSTPPR